MCDMGFTIIWKEAAGFDQDGVPIDKYFVYPPHNEGRLRYCYSPDSSVQDRGSTGRMELLRIVYEIVKSSITVKDENEQPTTPRKVKKARIVESAKKSSVDDTPSPGILRTGFPRTVMRPQSTPQRIGAVDRAGRTHYMFAYGVLEQETVYDSQCDCSDECQGYYQPEYDSDYSSSNSEVYRRAEGHRE